eukprot:TRINITY_DN27879_c0_g1_i1.p1 TRINITY_DN27879_c0_g1~~TRINITY_DN27879_c0_g1_i1.p1  ORF type:complete len:1796 (-),score=448.97 TRINITY_DN27879_c0_g1_i1:65-5374(-)
MVREAALLLLGLWGLLHLGVHGLPKVNSGLSRLEQEELAFMRNSLKREIDDAKDPTQADSPQSQENAIRRAYRNIARRFKRNIFNDQAKFEFQMRILNLAKEALVKGEGLGAEGWGEDEDDEEDENATKGSGRELPGSGRASDDILKQIHGWQEFALEEGVRFDDPDKAFFIGHTQHAYREAFAANWSKFVREDFSELWPAATALQYQVELDGSAGGEARARSLRLVEAARQLCRDALASIAGALHDCGGRDPPLAGPLPMPDDTTAWVDLHLKASRNLRVLFAGVSASLPESCAVGADKEARASLLELNLEALQQLGGRHGDGHGRADVAQEIRAAHAAASSARSSAMPLHCQESAGLKRTALERLWEEYQFGPLVEEAYPCDPCGLQGLASFLEFHIGRTGELLERRAEPDRTVLRALRGLMNLQQALARPASMSAGSSAAEGAPGTSEASSLGAGWRGAVSDVEEAVWKGIAFPELHTAVGQLMAEIANAGLLPEVLASTLEHPPVKGGLEGTTLPHGREPPDLQPVREPRFQGMSIPGISMKPVQRYEEKALRMWGDEEVEENWDPVRLGLSYIDLTPACDLPLQVAMCFLSAALWMWRALQLLGDNCGGDGWLDTYIFEEIWSAPPEAKRLAMQYSLKRAVLELVEYAGNMADHALLPGARLAVQRTGFLLLRQVTARFGTEEDAERVQGQLRRFLAAARVNPLWSPPLLPVSDAVFVDILAGRLHSAFLEKLHQADSPSVVLPSSVPDYTLYEAALLGGGEVNVTFARFEVMGSLLQDTQRSWEDLEALLADPPYRQDSAGFVQGFGRSPVPPDPQASQASVEEFAAVRGLRIDFATGRASLLLARPSLGAPPLLALDDLAGVLGVTDAEPLVLHFNPPADKGASMNEYPHHPFQSAVLSPTAEAEGPSRRTEAAMLHAALAVQQLAAGTEVSFRAPFPLRPCSEGLCRGLPKAAREKLQPIPYLRTEAWEQASRLVLECPRIPYWQKPAGNVLDVRFGDPKLEVHNGKPLRALNEEEFKTWPVPRLRAALAQVEKELGTRREDQLPALEKQELVDRLLRAAERGVLIEDEEESGDALARFARRLSHLLPEVGQRWLHVKRIGPLCALRAAGLILRMQLQQMNETSMQQQEGLREASQQHAEGILAEQKGSWRSALAEVHAGVLQQLGFVDLDPGGCFAASGGSRSFGQCCSVGDHAEQCWSQQLQQEMGFHSGESAREEELRCCGGAARRAAFSPQLVASVAAQLGSASPRRPPPQVLIPAVEAWLQDPTGRAASGETLSGEVVSLLIEEVRAEDVHQQQKHQLSAPVEKLAADLAELDRGTPALLPRGQGGGHGEAWLPVPTLAGAGGRRTLYATVGLIPQLLALDDDEAQAAEAAVRAATPGQWEEVSLDKLSEKVLRRPRSPEEAAEVFSPRLRALREAAALLQELDARTEELEENAGSAQQALQRQEQDAELEQLACGADGWREVNVAEAEVMRNLTTGQRVRMRQRGAEDVNGEEATIEAYLTLTGEPGTVAKVWEVTMSDDAAIPKRRFLDLADPNMIVGVPCEFVGSFETGNASNLTAGMEALAADEHVQASFDSRGKLPAEWPACIEVGVSTRSLDGSGLFVNLEALNIKEGCFNNDCSHSDHFAAASPAECARTCNRIGACRTWTFWEAAPSTCWIRGFVGGKPAGRIEAVGAVSGGSSCLPPREAGAAGPAEPTLFALLTRRSGTLPPDLWQEPDLVGTLEEFGHMTVSELRRAQPSHRQRCALRAAATAGA